jgi:hypothetical protein
MNDKRVAPRSDTFYYLQVLEPVSGDSFGRVVDISQRGLLIVTDRPGAIRERLEAFIRVPSASFETEGFRCTLHRRWQRPDRNPQLTLVGFEMTVDPEVLDTIEVLMKRYSFGGEFRVSDPES